MKSSAGKSGVPFPRLPGGFVPWAKAMEKIVEKLCRMSGVQVSVDGGTAGNSTGDGSEINLRVAGGVAEETAVINLKLYLKKYAAGQFYVTEGKVDEVNVAWGSVGGTELDDDFPQIFSATNARVWLALEYSMTFEQGWFVGGYLTGAYVTYGASIPTSNPSAGYVYVELGRIVSGDITRNTMGYSLYSLLRDNSSMSSSNAVIALARVA